MDVASTATLLLCVIVGGLLFLTSWKVHQKRRHLPPGPAPLPFLGNLRKIKPDQLYKTYLELSKQYGPVFTVWMGTAPVVVLCGYDVVREALVHHAEEFAGRPVSAINKNLMSGQGITNSNGEPWQVMRRFAISTLRNFGMGKRSMEERIQEELLHLVQAIKDTKGEAFNPVVDVRSAVSNVISLVVFGERFDYKDQAFLQILRKINQYFTYIRSFLGQLRNVLPKLVDLLPGPHHKILEETKSVTTFVREKIDWHQQTLDPASPRDFIDCFLLKANKKELEFTNENLVASTFDLFVAGTETTTGTIQYSLLVMAKYPHIQAKLQQEIDEVVGPIRSPGIDDRVKMPFTNAVISEIQRFLDLVPMALPHAMTRDTEFRGYTILKGTRVIPILTSVLHDPEQWETPDEFNPGHFLDEDGAPRNRAAFLPFSAGKRLCPGEAMARMELFIFLAGLLQNFTFQSLTDPESLDLAALRRNFRSTGLTYQLRAVRRQIAPA